jgi:signal transduction histidine kinase
MKDETCSGDSVLNVGSRVGRASLKVNSGATALGSLQSKLTHEITGLSCENQMGKVLGLASHLLEPPEKDSVAELANANEAMRKCLDGFTSVAELDDILGQMMAVMIRQLGAVAIQLTRLAQAARQAVVEERNQLAREIHDSLAQSFAGISMQLTVAEEELATEEGAALGRVRLANKIAELGLAEARRSALCLRSTVIEESGLVGALRVLAERSNVVGRLRCNFRSNCIPEETLPPRVQHELLRIAQEAISNAIRHGKSSVVSVTLRWEAPHLILQIKDNGSGISKTRLEKSEGIGLRSMRERAAQIDAQLDIRTGPSCGTRIIATAPISP